MQTLTHFKNQPKSDWAEDQIRNNLEAVERIIPNSGLIHAEIILEPNNEQTVHIDMNSPRLFEAHVAITDKNLMSAIHDATEKFVKMLQRKKAKIVDTARRHPSALKTMAFAEEPELDAIDASTVLKLEDRRRELLQQIDQK